MKRPGLSSGALLLGAKTRKSTPSVGQRHPKSATHPCLDRPPRGRSGPRLDSEREHQVAPVDGTLNARKPRGKIEAGLPPFLRTEQEVSQQLSSPRQLAVGKSRVQPG